MAFTIAQLRDRFNSGATEIILPFAINFRRKVS
jgi:hypothetical protein